jgi:hypothetical protein
VFEPTFVKNLTVTLDYYNIAVDKAISTIGEATILSGCYTTGNNPAYCALVQRDPASQQINELINLNQNVGSETSAGIDLAARYQLPTDFGRLGFTFDGTYLIKHNQTLADGTVVVGKNTYDLQDSAGQGGTNAAYKFNAGVLWGYKGWGAGVSTKFISSFHECGAAGDFSGSGLCYVDSTYKRKVGAYNTYDLFASYTLATSFGKTNVGVGMNNVFDTAPPRIYNSFASATDQYTYDQIGRFVYARLTHSY